MSEPRVLFVSKPVVPPWNDGSKNLVRDVASSLTGAKATVLTTRGGPTIPGVSCEPVYTTSGRFAPALTANARVLGRLLTGDAHDLWHFVFAPNPASSTAARVASRVRRATGWNGQVVQTIASAPRSFDSVARWIFGDVVIALSEWTRGRLLGAGVREAVRVIPPCVAAPAVPTEDAKQRVRARYDLGDDPFVVFPGDYETSRGAKIVARAVPAIVRAKPGTKVVFACRQKTAKSQEARDELEKALRAAGVHAHTRHLGEIDDLMALFAASTFIAFPVDDLYGKVDLPLVLLEALALDVPLVLARGGPLEGIAAARFVPPDDDEAFAAAAVALLTDAGERQARARDGHRLYDDRFTPRVVAAQYDALYMELLSPRSRR